jgi:hypothetical protein
LILALKIVLLVIMLMILLRFKVELALSIFLVTVLAVFLFQIDARTAWRSARDALTDRLTLELLAAVLLVQYIGAVQKIRRMFDRLVRSLNSFVRDSRIVSMVAPAIIGFFPMPGGALFSAPLVEASTRRMNLKPEFNAFLNFWFRHDWELVWPMFPSLLLFQAMSKIPLKRIILYQLPFSFLHILTGLAVAFLYFRRHRILRDVPEAAANWHEPLRDFFAGVWPLLTVIALYFVLAMPLTLTLASVSVLLTLAKRARPGEIRDILLSRTMIRSLLLVAAVMVFQKIVQVSGAFAAFSTMKVSLGVMVLFIFFISFAIGILTGYNSAYIAIAFPIFYPLIQPLPNYLYLALYAYVIGFAGILVSPVHLCLALTNEFFEAPLASVYRYLAFPIAVMIGVATILVLVL